MSEPVSPQIQTDLKLLEKHANEFLAVDLKYILQPTYNDKARRSVDALLTFVAAIKETLDEADHIHRTAVDTGLKNLQAVHKTLTAHYADPKDQAALNQAQGFIKKIMDDIKKLRAEVPRVEEEPGTAAKAKISGS